MFRKVTKKCMVFILVFVMLLGTVPVSGFVDPPPPPGIPPAVGFEMYMETPEPHHLVDYVDAPIPEFSDAQDFNFIFDLKVLSDVTPGPSQYIDYAEVWNGNNYMPVEFVHELHNEFNFMRFYFIDTNGRPVFTNIMVHKLLLPVEIGVKENGVFRAIDSQLLEIDDDDTLIDSVQLFMGPNGDVIPNSLWLSLDSSVVTVDAEGVLQAIGYGQSMIQLLINGTERGSILVVVNEYRQIQIEYIRKYTLDETEKVFTFEQVSELWTPTFFATAYIDISKGKINYPLELTVDGSILTEQSTLPFAYYEDVVLQTLTLAKTDIGPGELFLTDAYEEIDFDVVEPVPDMIFDSIDRLDFVIGFNQPLDQMQLYDYLLAPEYYEDYTRAFTYVNDGVFSFDETTLEVRPLKAGSGQINLTINGVTNTTDITVTEAPAPTMAFYEDELFLEQGALTTADLGAYLISADRPLEIGYDVYVVIDKVPYDRYEIPSSQLGSTTLTYVVLDRDNYNNYMNDLPYEALTFDRTITVVNSNLNNGTFHLDRDYAYFNYRIANYPNSLLVFYDLVNERTVFMKHLSAPEILVDGHVLMQQEIVDVGLTVDDQIYLLTANEGLFRVDGEGYTHYPVVQPTTTDRYQWMTGFAFGPNDDVYITTNYQLLIARLDHSSNSLVILETIDLYDHIDGYEFDTLHDVAVTEDGIIYISGNEFNDGHRSFVYKCSLENGFTIEAQYGFDNSEAAFGLSLLNDVLIVAYDENGLMPSKTDMNDAYFTTNLCSFDLMLTTRTEIEVLDRYYDTAVGSAGRYVTTLDADDISLHIGYNRTTAEGKAVINHVVTPSARQNYPVTYELISGNSVISLNTTSGQVTGLSAGSAQVRVTVDDVSTLVDITVRSYSAPPNPVSYSVRLTPDPIEVEYGPGADPDLLTLKAEATVSGTSNQNVTWSIGDESIATVDTNGVVTAVKTGETTLTVRSQVGNKTDTSTVIVYFIDEELDPLGLVEFNEPYVSGYPDTTFGPQKSVTRAELATMFARILNLELTGFTQSSYSDLKTDHWAFGYIEAASKAGLFSGYTTGEFKPSQPVSRGELSAVIAKYWQYFKMDVDQTPVVIKDVLNDYWAKNYIYMLYNAQLVTSFSDGTYRPFTDTLREQIVVMLNTLIGRDGLEKDPTYPDVTASHPQLKDIEAASTSVIIKTEIEE